MHCASCETLIKENINELVGIINVVVNHKTGEAQVTTENDNVTLEALIKAIGDAGYKAEVLNVEVTGQEVTENKSPNSPVKVVLETRMEASGAVSDVTSYLRSLEGFFHFRSISELPKVSESLPTLKQENLPVSIVPPASSGPQRFNLSISGMHCTSCAGIIEKSLKKVPGVSGARVSYAAEKAAVTLDISLSPKEKLLAAVKKAGYQAVFINPNDTQFESRKRQMEIKTLFNKFIFSLELSLPMLYFMLWDYFKWLPGTSFLPYIGVVSLVLATPVQFISGAGFYKGMWSSLKMKTFNMDSLIAIGTSVAYFYSVINLADYLIQK